MLDQEFCTYLEYKITEALGNSAIKEIESLWCDGILEFDNHYSREWILQNKQTTLKAFIGKDGQDEYNLTLNFGDKALRYYTNDLDLKESIPDAHDHGWFDIDPEKKEIIIWLD